MSEEFKGHDGLIMVEPFKVTIKFNRFASNEKALKEIFLRNITGIEIKKPTFFDPGYIEFLYPGADSDNKIVIASDNQYLNMQRVKQLIEHHLFAAQSAAAAPASPAPSTAAPAAASVSIVDELKKAAELRNAGILTNEEFEELKRRLLG
ncbi:SHOCT domain-containing protein [Cohnella mopanensis]|uniref:SHOCT domain-containing protein n=1 Tax=Cohnella mopanensis TaxID=2911966 RepID=UPI001EF991D1|nr:SHOCT domain-containing protein [Cohnella mopanensis]